MLFMKVIGRNILKNQRLIRKIGGFNLCKDFLKKFLALDTFNVKYYLTFSPTIRKIVIDD
jgi:hypothetical protein